MKYRVKKKKISFFLFNNYGTFYKDIYKVKLINVSLLFLDIV